MRQIYPDQAGLDDRALAARYAFPDLAAAGRAHWLKANMVTSLDGAASVQGRSGGLANEADRQIFAMLRALCDVILVGAGTVRAEHYGPVRPESEGLRWAWLREGRTPSPPIAVVTRKIDVDLDGALLTEAPAHARTIVVTTEMAPPDRREAAARTADVIIGGRQDVDLRAVLAELAARGLRRILAEGGPHLLTQLLAAGQVDELCLTVSPLLAGPGAGRIVQGAPRPDGAGPQPMRPEHVLADEGYLFCRYLQPS